MRVGVPKETAPGERRVALVPEVVKKLTGKGLEVVVESGAGQNALLPDRVFEEAGATVTTDAAAVWGAEVVVKVAPPSAEELVRLSKGGVLIGFLQPLTNGENARALAAAGVTSFALEAVPRISRAQSMDALSSQSNVAGYKAVLLGAMELTRFLPMLMTAAGTIRPAKVFVLGAGVAGLQAIATARRLGAVTEGFDVRPAVKEQVESLGATFVELDMPTAEGEGGYARALTEEEEKLQQQLLAEHMTDVDIVITTALVPGRRAPLLVTEQAVKNMKPGSVVVDLAGESGGNCELTEPGQTVVKHDVTICSPLNLASDMPEHASQLYARTIQSLLELMLNEEGELALDWEDEIIQGACLTRDGEIVHEGAKKAAGATA